MMERFWRAFSAALLAAALAGVPVQAISAQDQESRDQAEEMAREGMERIMRALDLFMGSIPQYELPQVNEHGDIIIRRKRKPEEREHKAPKEGPGEAET